MSEEKRLKKLEKSVEMLWEEVINLIERVRNLEKVRRT